jgi:membrane associated rhomboid family serine protease
MQGMDQASTLPPPPTTERCYRHPDVETAVHCTRCDKPICPDCMVAAPVGHHCPDCVAEARREYRQGPGRQIAVANAKATSGVLIVLGLMVAGYLFSLTKAGAGAMFAGPGSLAMVEAGGAFAPAIALADQYWRLVTPIFLHFGLIHLGLNALFIYLIGMRVERDFGRTRFLLIFLLTGIGGNVASYVFGPVNSVGAGASGAAFGLLGALLAWGYHRRRSAVGSMTIRWAVQILVINLFLGIAIPGIDLLAHGGGFVTGVALGYVLDDASPVRSGPQRAAAVVAISVLLVGLVLFRSAQLTGSGGALAGLA